MSWWGKLFGGTFGYMLGGPLGALIGAALGHSLDARMADMSAPAGRERIQTAFFSATFSVMGHLAKADGRVSEHEIRLAQLVMDQMQLTPRLKKLAQRLFNEGKQEGFDLDAVLDQLRRECRFRQMLLRMFIEVQLQAAYADGEVHPAERQILQRICQRLGFSPAVLEQLENLLRAGRAYQAGADTRTVDIDKAYAVLNVSAEATDAEVKRAYRRLMNQHHPDKLVAKGLPEEMMKLATEKTHEIRQAYDQIRAHRGQK